MKLPIGDRYPALLVCEQALGTDQVQKYVYVVKKVEKTGPDGAKVAMDQAVYQEVKVGRLHGGLRVITEGLKKDDRVIVGGLQRVQRDTPVKATLLEHKPILSGADEAKKESTQSHNEKTNHENTKERNHEKIK